MKPFFLADNRLLDGAVTATAADPDFPVANLGDRKTYTFYKGAAASEIVITVDCGAAQGADTIGVLNHNLDSATLSVESSDDNVLYTVRLAPFVQSGNGPIVKVFPLVGARYWRVRIDTPAAVPEIAVLILGKRLEFPRFPIKAFTPNSITYKDYAPVSKTGHLLGVSVLYPVDSIKANFKHLDAQWVLNEFKPFFDANKRSPFFYVWDLDQWSDNIVWARFKGAYKPKFATNDRVLSLPLQLTGTYI